MSSAQWAEVSSISTPTVPMQAQSASQFDPSFHNAAASLAEDLNNSRSAAGVISGYTSKISEASLDANRDSVAGTGAVTEPQSTAGSAFASQLTLDALGLSLADTGAAMEADSEVGALTLQSLGLTIDDVDEEQVVDAPEDIADRMSRILDTFGTNVGATADFVLVSQAMEPEVSYVQPPSEIGSQATAEQSNPIAESLVREGRAAPRPRDHDSVN